MGNINIRTDLAVELNEAVDKSDSRYSGVIEESILIKCLW